MKVTMQDIADRAGVTKRVVSAVVNNDFSRIGVGKEKREKIRALVKELNYRPDIMAQMFKNRRTNIINVIIPSAFFFMNIHHSTVIAGLQEKVGKDGYQLNFTTLHFGKDVPVELTDAIADAVVFFYWSPLQDDLLQEMVRTGLPVLTVHGRCTVPGVHNLYFDNEDAMYRLTRDMLEKGHLRIGYVPAFFGDQFHIDGHAGIARAIGENPDAELKRFEFRRDFGRWSTNRQLFDWGYETFDVVMADSFKPTFLVYTNDFAALGALRRAKETGLRVPEDIALAGGTDEASSEIWDTPLTTVNRRDMAYGSLTGERMVGMLREPDRPCVKEPFAMELLYRSTT